MWSSSKARYTNNNIDTCCDAIIEHALKLPHAEVLQQDDFEECDSLNIDETTTDDSIMSHVVDVLSSVEHTASQSDAVLVTTCLLT